MRKTFKTLMVTGGLAAVLPLVGVTAAPAVAVPTPSVVYDAIPALLPSNVASLGFQATSTSQFGDFVHLAGTSRVLQKITVTMSDWALYADYSVAPLYMANSVNWTHPITVNVYSSHLAVNGVPDTLLATRTQTVTIPWRPAQDPINCPTKDSPGYAYKWQSTPGLPDTNCSNGFAFNASFDFSSLNVTLLNDVIVGVAYSTQSYGTTPLGVNGPYNSLNVGVATGQTASVGTDDNPDIVFWSTSYGGFYTDGGASGVGIFRQDTRWTGNGTVNLRITASVPLVGPPTDKNQCKNGGWASFNNPSFKNQGDCVSSVATNQ